MIVLHILWLILRILLWTLLGLVVLVLLTPVGADIGYEGGVLRVSAKVWGLKLQLYPRAPRDKQPRQEEKKPEEKKPEQPKEDKPRAKRALPVRREELPSLLLELVRALLKSFGRFGRKFKVDRFRFVCIAAGQDPYTVAVNYGRLNAALLSLAPLCRKRFAVRDCEVYTAVDFNADWPQLELALAVSIRIGQILATVFSVGFGALRILLPAIVRKRREDRKAPPPADEKETDARSAA